MLVDFRGYFSNDRLSADTWSKRETPIIDGPSMRRFLIGLTGIVSVSVISPSAAFSDTAFSGVAAGDMSASDAIIWTRTFDSATGQPSATALTAQLAAEPEFRNVLFTYHGLTDAARAGTIKIAATGLQGHTRYFFRFVAEDGSISPTGQFVTAPDDDRRVAVRFAFSGDAQGDFRPYPLLHRFGELNLDFFVFLGDTMYETESSGSPAAEDAFANPALALADYRRKYLENILPTRPEGTAGLKALFAAQGNYTLLDNHELGGGGQFVSGGAPVGDPPGKGVDSTDPANDANSTCKFINQTPGFAVLLQAYLDFQPVRERRVAAPDDCRTDGTWQLYFAQRWGKNVIFINVDDRSYRDIQLTGPNGGDTGPRADNPKRTMLGATQLAWLEQTLLEAQKQEVIWKIVAVSSPIDEMGTFDPRPFIPSDGPKTWIGGYRSERNHLLKYIAENHIEHVVFLTTDDHLNRVHGLYYYRDSNDPRSRTEVPGAFTVVAGPIGAIGPDSMARHDFNSVKSVADKLAAAARAAGIEPIGLRPDFPGLKLVYREGDPRADTLRQPADFYSADTFNYVTIEISAEGRSLAVDTWGIESYQSNSFPEPDQISGLRHILGFRIDAD